MSLVHSNSSDAEGSEINLKTQAFMTSRRAEAATVLLATAAVAITIREFGSRSDATPKAAEVVKRPVANAPRMPTSWERRLTGNGSRKVHLLWPARLAMLHIASETAMAPKSPRLGDSKKSRATYTKVLTGPTPANRMISAWLICATQTGKIALRVA